MTLARTRLGGAAAAFLVTGAAAFADPVPAPPPVSPAGPVAIPYPDAPPKCTHLFCLPTPGGVAQSAALLPPPVPKPDPRPFPCPLRFCPFPIPPGGAALQLQGDGGTAIEVESFSWGAAGDRPPVSGTADPQEGGQFARQVYTSDPQEGGEVAAAGRKAGSSQQKYPTRSPRGEPLKPALSIEHEVTSPRDIASGQAEGKRQHRPIAMERGSLFVTVPEGLCVAGARYPSVVLRTESEAYTLSDVSVAACESVATAKGRKDKAKLDYMVVKMESVLISG